ncbi:hypothetical protein N7463_007791 [Penicillium fimorum]|uniref:Uncharacterized protein n=1 Tax=Penicillium fimorum TaxID=1882269 RepID=A0A9W9XWZ4_9EURO|nr:hypothetical protein N7463_007791 [Penicillium fimorum]
MWDFAFEELVKQDTMVWKSPGVDRPPHFVQPSGSIKSPLAVHPFNPTFFVAESHSTLTDDATNQTIRLLYECGLSADHYFMFDEICRRERTDDCLLFYTEDLRRPHRDFIHKLREICRRLWKSALAKKFSKRCAKLLVWPGCFDKTSSEFFDTYGRPQDLAISMATKLAGLQHQIKIKPSFFESHFVRGKKMLHRGG